MKEFKHFGVYGIIIENNNIILVKKNGGPYDGKFDLPGGSIEFGETPLEALKRELNEEIGIDLKTCELIDADSVKFNWEYNGEMLNWHHIGIFYKVLSYDNNVKESIEIDSKNNDSFGAVSLDINNLKKEALSQLAIQELEKLGITLN